MVITVTVGEEIIIDGRIRIRILAIDGEEVHFEVSFPEFLHSDRNGGRVWPLAGWLGLKSAAGTFGKISFPRQLLRRSVPGLGPL